VNQSGDILSADALATARSEIASLLTGGLAVDATYSRFTAGAFSPSTGAKGGSYADTAVRVVAASDARAEGGTDASRETFVWLLATDQVAFAPGTEDRLVVGAVTYDVVSAEQDTLGSHWALVTRRG